MCIFNNNIICKNFFAGYGENIFLKKNLTRQHVYLSITYGLFLSDSVGFNSVRCEILSTYTIVPYEKVRGRNKTH